MAEAETNVGGYWKGVAVTPTFQFVVDLVMEHNGDELTGRFESHDPQNQSSEGRFRGTMREGEIRLHAENGSRFHGHLVGQMIHGHLQRRDDQYPTATLTVFVASAAQTPGGHYIDDTVA